MQNIATIDKTRNSTTDIFKLIASFFIVLIHAEIGTSTDMGVVRLLGRWGVPFFFLLSGYFYQKSLEKTPLIALNKNLFKIFCIYLVANILYYPLLAIDSTPFKLRYIWAGDYSHLWFLPSMMIGFITIYLLKKFNVYVSFFITLFIIVLAVLSGSYSSLLGTNPDHFTTRVRSLLSIPFMLIGGYFYYLPQFKKILKPRLGLIMLFFGLILQFIEVYFLYINSAVPIEIHQFLIGTSFFSVGIFILSLTIRINNTILGNWGRDYALFIYLYHPMYIFFILHLMDFASMSKLVLFILPIPVFIVTLLTGVVFNMYFRRLFLLLTGSIKEAFT